MMMMMKGVIKRRDPLSQDLNKTCEVEVKSIAKYVNTQINKIGSVLVKYFHKPSIGTLRPPSITSD